MYDKYTTVAPTQPEAGVILSDMTSLRLAESIPRPDRDATTAAVKFATLIGREEGRVEADDAMELSRRLLKEDRIGFLEPELLQGANPIAF